jgi:sporulation protein YlmC with PRC-barrel domain
MLGCTVPGALMGEIEEFIVGSDVACSDGPCGVLSRVIIDPIADAVAYLDVESKHRRHHGHLVPVSLVAAATAKEIRLTCSKAEFDALEPAQEKEFLPGVEGQSGYSPAQALRLPYFRQSGVGLAMPESPPTIPENAFVSSGVTYDKLPLGDVDVRRGEHVEATDGPIGKVKGLVIDPSDEQVTHILLDEGHLWGEKTVGIPISAVKRLGEVIRLTLSQDEIRELPPIDVEHPV